MPASASVLACPTARKISEPETKLFLHIFLLLHTCKTYSAPYLQVALGQWFLCTVILCSGQRFETEISIEVYLKLKSISTSISHVNSLWELIVWLVHHAEENWRLCPTLEAYIKLLWAFVKPASGFPFTLPPASAFRTAKSSYPGQLIFHTVFLRNVHYSITLGRNQRLDWCALKTEEGTLSQGTEVATRS